jgi:enoyl-CoA hydratase/carnithine racemase
MPAICDNSVLAFNECSLGFVPHAGATYYASRLPGDFGTFLLLTGIPFSGQDAINLNLADKYIIEPETFDSLLRDYMINFNFGEQPTHAEMLGLFNRNYEHNHRPINEWGTRKSVIEDNFNIQKYYYNY